MKTLKLILKSLISNNACIDGGRKRPWYIAVIMFFLSAVFAVLPLFIQTMNTNGDDTFKSYSYGADVATLGFNNYLKSNNYKIVVKTSPSGEKFFSGEDSDGNPVEKMYYPHEAYKQVEIGKDPVKYTDYNFYFRSSYDMNEFNELLGDGKTSLVYICSDSIFLNIVNVNTQAVVKQLACNLAPKYMEEGRSINSLLVEEGTPTDVLNNTWSNWKLFIRDAYNFTRLTMVWQTVAIMSAINVGITVFMGLMIWILTRGKNNPYRLFNLWDTQKMCWWAAITPSILTLAFGFLIPNFANILFPLILGVRIMWLSMKSLRPDGSGYAASE